MEKLTNKELEKIFENIKNEVEDYEEHIENGDIFYPLEVAKCDGLTNNEKMYLCTYYCKNKNIKQTDEYISKLVSNVQKEKIKKKLAKLNVIKEVKLSAEQLKIKTIELSNKGNKCEWCGKESYILHKHHYPISEKNGGTEIVNICPNCHYTFHKLESERYE